jgi:hypothetical protein
MQRILCWKILIGDVLCIQFVKGLIVDDGLYMCLMLSKQTYPVEIGMSYDIPRNISPDFNAKM